MFDLNTKLLFFASAHTFCRPKYLRGKKLTGDLEIKVEQVRTSNVAREKNFVLTSCFMHKTLELK